MTYRIGSMCSGYGGLEMAVRAVLGGEVAWMADNDPGAAAILAHRFPLVPNLEDITKTDWAAAEPVDVMCAGFPCQPVSAAGRRKGTEDERWLFDDICAALGRMVTLPGMLVLENVPGLLSANGGDAMARVVHGLAALGYEHTYRLVRASDAGAPHRRERWFCLAWQDNPDGASAARDRRLAADATGVRRQDKRDADLTRGGGSADEPHRRLPAIHNGLLGERLGDPAQDPDRPVGGEWRLPAPGQEAQRGSWADTGGPGGALVADAGHRAVPERPWAERWQEGQRPPERGPVAAQRGDRPFADAHGTSGGRHGQGSGPSPLQGAAVAEWPQEQPGRLHSGSGDTGPLVAADPHGGRGDGLHERVEPGHLAPDPERGSEGIRPGPAPGQTDWGAYGPAIARWERALGRVAPRPTEPGRTGERLSPRFVEWMQGLPEGWVTGVRGLSRNAQLKALGNGVVPQQAILALSLLLPACLSERAA